MVYIFCKVGKPFNYTFFDTGKLIFVSKQAHLHSRILCKFVTYFYKKRQILFVNI